MSHPTLFLLLLLSLFVTASHAFFAHHTPRPPQPHITTSTAIAAAGSRSIGRSTPNHGQDSRSKRQERVGHLVRTELSRIIHGGLIKRLDDYLEDDLRKRISIVNADVSPDLKQARITVSITADPVDRSSSSSPSVVVDQLNADVNDTTQQQTTTVPASSAAVDKRRAYAWLVRNTKPIRYTLAQSIRHIKSCPDLSFVQVDVAAAVDVMYLIDKVSGGYKRDDLFGSPTSSSRPSGVVDGIDFDQDFDENEWEEEDDDFF